MLGSDVGSADYTGWTPFHEAVRTQRCDIVELMINHGSDVRWPVQATAPFSGTPLAPPGPDEPLPVINALHIAVGIYSRRYDATSQLFSPEIVRLLLENGIDPNAKAMHIGRLSSCGVLEDASPLQILFNSVRIPMRWAAKYPPGFFAVVQLLIDYGADVRGIANGLTTFHIAKFEGYESLWDFLRKDEPIPTE
ncbi:ankyrin repeat-containing domain protein [Paraphoma chrysanthemicola]|uniref:Ankyrin repeat-containing domain protein n=1 Tax=Paraphoma chrysanthemicola TaxID=798071 RepID=A0A8K0R7L5_9PLEO|nr:ankyrin repeat-containing domain protein [Paraphoma chrysanthemicola]